MANALDHRKLMTIGEGGSALAFAALAMFSIVVAAKAFTPEFAFHAYLFAAASIAAVFAIINRYYERPKEATPLIVDDRQREALIVAAENIPGVKEVKDHLAWVETTSGVIIEPSDEVRTR